MALAVTKRNPPPPPPEEYDIKGLNRRQVQQLHDLLGRVVGDDLFPLYTHLNAALGGTKRYKVVHRSTEVDGPIYELQELNNFINHH